MNDRNLAAQMAASAIAADSMNLFIFYYCAWGPHPHALAVAYAPDLAMGIRVKLAALRGAGSRPPDAGPPAPPARSRRSSPATISSPPTLLAVDLDEIAV